MAKPGKRKARKAASKADLATHVIEVAFALAAERGWRDLALADIAAEAKVPMADLYALYRSKQAILAAFSRQVDNAMLAEADAPEGPAKDRLFDLLMRRFDELDPHKAGLTRIAEDTGRDPLSLVCSLARLDRSMAATLEAAGLSTSGLRGLLRIKGLTAIYLAGLRAWLRDDSDDKAKTMAALDRALTRVDRLAGGFQGRKKRAAA
jgi:AcrR family transcriptional regulator